MTASSSAAKRPNLMLLALSLAGISYAVLSSAVIPALPTIQHQLHTTETGVTWLLTGYLISASAGTSILGRLGDMYGKEKLLLYTLLMLVVGTLMAALVNSLMLLIVARVIQGAAGGIFPLAFGIVRDEFPKDRVPGSIGLLSSVLGVGGGLGIVLAGVIVEHLDYHWLFWLPLAVILAAAVATWMWVPESPVRVPGKINWPAAGLMTVGMTAVLVAVSETTVWGWGSVRTLVVLLAGAIVCVGWVMVEARSKEPLVDMTMMRIKGVWTTNAAAFLLGAGLYASFVIYPQFAQLPRSTGFGFGASVVDSGVYLVPATAGMFVLGLVAGRISARFGSKQALAAGTIFTAVSFVFIALAHAKPWEMMVSAGVMGVGIGLSFAALGNLIVQAVPAHQTGVASGMNTVMRTLGGALGGQLSATFIAGNTAHGLPTVTGFLESFWMATGFLLIALGAALMVPARGGRTLVQSSPALTPVEEPA